MHNDFLAAATLAYTPSQLKYSSPAPEAESAEYGACSFDLNGFNIRFRVAKITPTKIGQFVTAWKRSAAGITQPYDASDPVDFFVISARSGQNFGQFVFPKSILCAKGVFSTYALGGKRGIRVYPPWDKAISKQVQKTQAWQIQYFLDLSENHVIDCDRVKLLYSTN